MSASSAGALVTTKAIRLADEKNIAPTHREE
jgi:hypothetical protein